VSSSFLAAAGLIDEDDEVAEQEAPAPAAAAPPRSPARRPTRQRRVEDPRAELAAGFLVAAAHGGAGAGTVAGLLDIALGGGAGAEPKAPAAVLASRRRQLVLVARANAYGLSCAAARLPSIAHHRPVLVLVADAPAADPAAVRYRLQALRGQVTGVVRVPFLPALRAVDHVGELADHPKIRRAAQQLSGVLSRIHRHEGA